MTVRQLTEALCLRYSRALDGVCAALRWNGASDDQMDAAISEHTRVALANVFDITIKELAAVESDLRRQPPAKTKNEYTVCFLFDRSLNHVLLLRKANTRFAGLLNGVGGKLAENETAEQCALRKIKDETGVNAEDIENFSWAGTLTLPEDCSDEPTDCVLHYYTGIVDEKLPVTAGHELVEWHNTNYVQGMSITSAEHYFAGNGNLQLFVHMSLMRHAAYKAAQK